LLKLDKTGRQEAKISSFYYITLYAIANQSVKLVVNHKDSIFYEWSKLRITFKTVVYRSSKLEIRPSDVDAGDVQKDLDVCPEDQKEEVNAEFIQSNMESFAPIASDIVTLMESLQPDKVPVIASALSGQVKNQSMLALLQHVTNNGGGFSTPKDACLQLVGLTYGNVLDSIPTTWDACADFMQKVVNAGEEKHFDASTFGKLASYGNVPDLLSKLRIAVFAHCLKSLGMERCNCREAPLDGKPFRLRFSCSTFRNSAIFETCQNYSILECLKLLNVEIFKNSMFLQIFDF